MKEVILEGTEVLIFFGHERRMLLDETNFIKGKVISCNKYEYNSNSFNNNDEVYYTVLGEDGNMYSSVHYSTSCEGCFIRTIPEQISIIDRKIDSNLNEIERINDENKRLMDTYKSLVYYNEVNSSVKKLIHNKND